jgi:hypothetical protein
LKNTMFKNDRLNHLAGVLNLGGGSVPSIGTPSLASALAAFERAEAVLESARATARAAARREGVSVAGLFEGSSFIRRSTGERWADTARNEGWSAGHRFLSDALSRSVSTEALDEKSPFRHLAKRLKQIRPEDWPEHVAKMRAVMNSAGPRWERMRAAGYFEAIEAEDHERAAEIYREANPELFAQSKGEAILAAGRRARMSADAAGEVPEPKKGTLAAQILAAGRKARRPTGSDDE